MLDEDITDVPEDERHRASGLRGSLFSVIPRVAAPIDASGTVAIDVDPLAAEDEPSGMVLESNWV